MTILNRHGPAAHIAPRPRHLLAIEHAPDSAILAVCAIAEGDDADPLASRRFYARDPSICCKIDTAAHGLVGTGSMVEGQGAVGGVCSGFACIGLPACRMSRRPSRIRGGGCLC